MASKIDDADHLLELVPLKATVETPCFCTSCRAPSYLHVRVHRLKRLREDKRLGGPQNAAQDTSRSLPRVYEPPI